NDALTATLLSGPGHGSLNFHADGSFTYTPAAGYVGPDSFTYRVSDGMQTSNPATVYLTVQDAPLSGTGRTITPVEGATFSGAVPSFTYPDPSPSLSNFSATINWGDGFTTSGTVAANGSGGFDVSGAHKYVEEGGYTLTTTINDAKGATTTVTGTANVADAALTAHGVDFTAAALLPFFGTVATFTDAGGLEPPGSYTATIDWGDGGPSTSGEIGNASVSGMHTYAAEGSYTVTVTVLDEGGSTVTPTAHATVGGAALPPDTPADTCGCVPDLIGGAGGLGSGAD